MFWTSAAILLALGFASAQYPLEQGIVPNDQYTAAPVAAPLGTDGWRTGRSTFFDGSDTFKNAYIARYINCLIDPGLHICGRTHACNDQGDNPRAQSVSANILVRQHHDLHWQACCAVCAVAVCACVVSVPVHVSVSCVSAHNVSMDKWAHPSFTHPLSAQNNAELGIRVDCQTQL